MPPTKTFGQSLKLYRQARDLTQADLAEQVGCATESIRKMEANRQRPSKFLAARLADMLVIPEQERGEFLSLARTRIDSSNPRLLSASSLPSVINLPAQMTALVGRQQDLAAARALLQQPEVHLITLTGPGGVGKTRLAAQIALESLNEFLDGAYFVPLAAITDASSVSSAIAQVLHIRATSEQFLKYFGAHFRDKHCLIILDNFEHVLAAAPLVSELIETAPHLRILVTSRTTLSLYGEHEINVRPLEIPDLKSLPPSAQLTQYDSVRIFLERIRTVVADFTLTEANAPIIAEICYRLDGLPLALELAAANGKLLSPFMLLERLKKEPIDLSSTASNLPERHSTLRNTIQWSYQLLKPAEQDLFQQLSVFSGGCTLEGVETVCMMQEKRVLAHLGSLLDRSLLQQLDVSPDERRYVMLDTIRTYASEQLRLAGQEDQVYQRHLDYYLTLAEEIAPKLLVGSQQRKWLNRLEREIGNLRVAIQWAVQHQRGEAVVRLCNMLEYFWYEFGDPDEIFHWVEAALAEDMNLPAEMRASALRFTGYVLMTMQIDYLRAKLFLERALRLWQELDNQAEIADTLARLGIVALELGEYNRSQALYEECLKISEAASDAKGVFWAREWLGVVWMRQGQAQKAREVFESSLRWWHKQGDLQSEAFALNNLGAVAMYEGNYDEARIYHEQALALWETIGDIRGTSSALNAMGPVALRQGNPGEAFTFLSQSLSLRWETQDYNGIAWNLERLAEVAFSQEHFERGAQLWGAAQGLREKYHSPLFPADLRRYEPVLETAHQKLGKAVWGASCAIGRAKPIEEIVSYALEQQDFSRGSS